MNNLPKIGNRVHIPEHTQYQHLKVNAIVKPAVKHIRHAHTTTIVEVLRDEYEDQHGKPVFVDTYVMANGEHYQRDEFEVIS